MVLYGASELSLCACSHFRIDEMSNEHTSIIIIIIIIIIITQVSSYYTYLLSLGDCRVESWPLMASPMPTAVLTIAYLLVRLTH